MPHILCSIRDDDDDVRAVAATCLIPVAHKVLTLLLSVQYNTYGGVKTPIF